MKWVSPFSAVRGSDVLFPNDFGEDLSKLKDFSSSQAVTYTGKVVISRKLAR